MFSTGRNRARRGTPGRHLNLVIHSCTQSSQRDTRPSPQLGYPFMYPELAEGPPAVTSTWLSIHVPRARRGTPGRHLNLVIHSCTQSSQRDTRPSPQLGYPFMYPELTEGHPAVTSTWLSIHVPRAHRGTPGRHLNLVIHSCTQSSQRDTRPSPQLGYPFMYPELAEGHPAVTSTWLSIHVPRAHRGTPGRHLNLVIHSCTQSSQRDTRPSPQLGYPFMYPELTEGHPAVTSTWLSIHVPRAHRGTPGRHLNLVIHSCTQSSQRDTRPSPQLAYPFMYPVRFLFATHRKKTQNRRVITNMTLYRMTKKMILFIKVFDARAVISNSVT